MDSTEYFLYLFISVVLIIGGLWLIFSGISYLIRKKAYDCTKWSAYPRFYYNKNKHPFYYWLGVVLLFLMGITSLIAGFIIIILKGR